MCRAILSAPRVYTAHLCHLVPAWCAHASVVHTTWSSRLCKRAERGRRLVYYTHQTRRCLFAPFLPNENVSSGQVRARSPLPLRCRRTALYIIQKTCTNSTTCRQRDCAPRARLRRGIADLPSALQHSP